MGPSRQRDDRIAFIRSQARLADIPSLPQMRLWQADQVTPLWTKTAEELASDDVEPPFWAFAWAGGQGVARYLFDNPGIVRGRRVLDVAAGSGLVAISAALCGAVQVTANDIDPWCEAAVALNAQANGVAIHWRGGNLLTSAPPMEFDVILAGDVFYEQGMAAEFHDWLTRAAQQGARVIAGDPGRAYAPASGVRLVAQYAITTPLEIESSATKTVSVLDYSG